MTPEILESVIKASPSRTAPGMRRALHDIVVLGHTWRQAAIAHEVTESGILRAMRRLGLGRYARGRIDLTLHAKNIST